MDSPGVRPAKGLAHGMINKDRPGCPYPRHNVPDRANGQCRNPLGFNKVGNETHGLVTPGSVGYQHGQIHTLPRELAGQDRGQLLLDFPVALNPSVY